MTRFIARAPRARLSRAAAAAESLEARRLFAAFAADLGSYAPASGAIQLDYGRNGTPDVARQFGQAGDVVLAGDFDGNTVTDLAVYRNGVWGIDLNHNGTFDLGENFGGPGLRPVVGDVNGDGRADLGVYNPATGVWQFDTNLDGKPDVTFTFGTGSGGGAPFIADMNGDGIPDAVLWKKGTWTVDYSLSGNVKTLDTFGGAAGDAPVIADINGDSIPDLGIFNAGTWSFDTDVNGVGDTFFQSGGAGQRPLAGYFDTTASLYVAPGGTGNGTLTSPFGTVAAALSAVNQGKANGTRIRLAAGTYAENGYLFGSDNVDIIGAGQNATIINPTSGAGLFLDRDTNLWLYNLHVRSTDRSIVSAGSSVLTRGITTKGTGNIGYLSASYLGVNAALDAAFSHFDRAKVNDGLRLESGTAAVLRNDTFNANGTTVTSAYTGFDEGRGLVVQDSCSVDAKYCSFSNNYLTGIEALDSSDVRVRFSTIANTKTFDGALVNNTATAVFRQNTFSHNGPMWDITAGRNDIEVTNLYTGPGVTITGNTFLDSSGGVYAGNGNDVLISDNTFVDELIGVGINGATDPSIQNAAIDTNATVTGNTFTLDTAAPSGTFPVGVYALGSKGTGTVGSDDPSGENTFNDYPSGSCIVTAHVGLSPKQEVGTPTLSILKNVFNNSPDPIVLGSGA